MATTLATAVGGHGGDKTPPELAAKIKMIRAMNGELDNALPPAIKKVLTPDRMTRLVVTAMRQVRNLDQCTFASLAGSLMVAAQLGLEPCTPLGHCYLIPRKNGRTGQFEATFQLGYQGMLELAYRTEVVQSITAKAVHDFDVFIYEEGLEDKLIHRPFLNGDRGPVIAYYAVIKFTNGGHAFDVMTYTEMVKHMERFAPTDYKTGKVTGPWLTDFDEMAKKTVLRRLFKLARKSTDIVAKATLYDERVVDKDRDSSELQPQFDEPRQPAQIAPPQYQDEPVDDVMDVDPEPDPEPAPPPKAAVKAAPKKKPATAAAKAADPAPVPEDKPSPLAATVASIESWLATVTAQNDECGMPDLADRDTLMDWLWAKFVAAGQVKAETKHLYSRLNELAKLGGDTTGTLRLLDAAMESVRNDYMGSPAEEQKPAEAAAEPAGEETIGSKVAALDKLAEEWAGAFADAGVQTYAAPASVIEQVYFRAMKTGLVSANAQNYRAKTKDLATIAETFDGIHKKIHPILEAMWADFVKDEPGSDG